jgi:phosphatidylglycerophosphate synthase
MNNLDSPFASTMSRLRIYRSKHLKPIAEFLLKLGFTANKLTALSFICGVLAVYFLFQDYYWFLVFAFLHLGLDSLDGVVARLSEPTRYGNYFDHVGDNIVALIALIKLAWYLQDYYVYLIAGLYFTEMLIFFTSKMRAPAIFVRSGSLVVLIILSSGLVSKPEIYYIIGYLIVGVTSVFMLAKQLEWFLRKHEKF